MKVSSGSLILLMKKIRFKEVSFLPSLWARQEQSWIVACLFDSYAFLTPAQ